MKKRFVLDTNILLYDPKSIETFGNNEIIIPISVLDELDKSKLYSDEIGRNARFVIRELDKLRKVGSLKDGVKFGESTIKVEFNHDITLPDGLSKDLIDNRILNVAKWLSENEETPVVVVTRDINLRVKCNAIGIESEDYINNNIKVTSSLYQGFDVIDVPSDELNKLYTNGFIHLKVDGYPNQFFLLKSLADPKQTGLTRLYPHNVLKLVPPKCSIWGINPRNVEQRMAMNLLLDPTISLVTLVGRAGSGKTLLAAATALHYVLDGGESGYYRALMSRPIQPMGKDLGFLPGTVEEKLQPWMAALNDNLELLISDHRQLDMYKAEGLIQVESLTHIRGRSIPNSFIILDEAQNLSPQEIKTVITRVGEGSKIVITGDIEQIDNPDNSFSRNGLTHVIERLKKYDMTGHIVLTKGERSELASIASIEL